MSLPKFILLSLALAAVTAHEVLACHLENSSFAGNYPVVAEGGPGSLEGHKHSSSAGISSATEYTLAFTSTSSYCKHYVFFLEREYEFIAEESALGMGEHLIALAKFNGCPEEVQAEFAAVVHQNHQDLFYQTSQVYLPQFQRDLRQIISASQTLNLQCQL